MQNCFAPNIFTAMSTTIKVLFQCNYTETNYLNIKQNEETVVNEMNLQMAIDL